MMCRRCRQAARRPSSWSQEWISQERTKRKRKAAANSWCQGPLQPSSSHAAHLGTIVGFVGYVVLVRGAFVWLRGIIITSCRVLGPNFSSSWTLCRSHGTFAFLSLCTSRRAARQQRVCSMRPRARTLRSNRRPRTRCGKQCLLHRGCDFEAATCFIYGRGA